MTAVGYRGVGPGTGGRMADEQATHRRVDPRCPSCGGERIDVELLATGLHVVPLQRRRRYTFAGSAVTGVACLDCGLLELYADDPEQLRRRREPPPDARTEA